MNDPIFVDILKSLDMVAIECLDNDSLKLIGPIPDWFRELFPNAVSQDNKLCLSENCPFLESFLGYAEGFCSIDKCMRLLIPMSRAWLRIQRYRHAGDAWLFGNAEAGYGYGCWYVTVGY